MWSKEEQWEEELPIGYCETEKDTVDPVVFQSQDKTRQILMG